MVEQKNVGAPGEPKYVFISYRRGDTSMLARLLHHELERWIGGNRVFLDREDIEKSADFVRRIEQAISGAGVVLALLGPRWLAMLNERLNPARRGVPDYVFEELKQALQSSVPVLPILVDGASMPAAIDLPAELAPLTRCNALELTDKFFEPQAQGILDVVRRHLNLPIPGEIAKSPRDRQLLDAAIKGDTSRIRVLLKEGVPVDIRAEDGSEPLMIAAAEGHAHAMRFLLDHGADIHAVNQNGITALIAAAMKKCSPLAVNILLKRGAEVDARTNDGSTALLWAARRGDPDVVDNLLKHGADPNVTNDNGAFPLHAAVFIEDEKNREEVLKLLSEAVKRRRGN